MTLLYFGIGVAVLVTVKMFISRHLEQKNRDKEKKRDADQISVECVESGAVTITDNLEDLFPSSTNPDPSPDLSEYEDIMTTRTVLRIRQPMPGGPRSNLVSTYPLRLLTFFLWRWVVDMFTDGTVAILRRC